MVVVEANVRGGIFVIVPYCVPDMGLVGFLASETVGLPNGFWLIVGGLAHGATHIEGERYEGFEDELAATAEQLNSNPFTSKQSSAAFGSIVDLVAYVLLVVVYVAVFSPREIFAELGEFAGVDLLSVVQYSTVSQLGPAQHVVYFPVYAVSLVVLGRLAFLFVVPIVSAVVNSVIFGLVAKVAANAPLVVVVPVGTTLYALHRGERHLRFVLAGRPSRYELHTTRVKAWLGADASLSDIGDYVAERSTAWTRRLRYLSHVETVVLLVGIAGLSVRLRHDPGLATPVVALARAVAGETSLALERIPLPTVVGVLLVFHGRSFVDTTSLGTRLQDRLFITGIGLVSVGMAAVVNPSRYFDWLPTVWTVFDYLIAVYVLIVAANLTVHLLDHATEVR